MNAEFTTEQQDELEEYRYAAQKYIENPCAGTRYALAMSASALQILGLDPSCVTPTGYDTNAKESAQ